MAGCSRVEMLDINLRVSTRSASGEPLYLVTTAGHCTFYLREYPGESASDGLPAWRIARWEDKRFGNLSPAGLENSWGQIKYLYSRP